MPGGLPGRLPGHNFTDFKFLILLQFKHGKFFDDFWSIVLFLFLADHIIGCVLFTAGIFKLRQFIQGIFRICEGYYLDSFCDFQPDLKGKVALVTGSNSGVLVEKLFR